MSDSFFGGNMKGTIGIILGFTTALSLGACTTATQNASYRPRSGGNLWDVQARYNEFTDEVLIVIDGQEVVSAAPPVFGSTGEASADYNGHKVHAVVTRTSDGWTDKMGVSCSVQIDGERVARFEF